MRVLDKILRDGSDAEDSTPSAAEEEPKATPQPSPSAVVVATAEPTPVTTVSGLVNPTPVPTVAALVNPTPVPTVAAIPDPTPEPTTVPSSQTVKKPQMPDRQTIAKLPLPRGVNHSDLLQFTQAHADVLAPYQPLPKEWDFYAKSFVEGAKASELEVKTMRLRIVENFPRAHWLFVWGLQQTAAMLLGKTGTGTFLIDRQEDFLGRMSLLLFLSNELQQLSQRSEYRDTLKSFYKNANAKYFKRPLIDRPARPEGPLRPPTPVNVPNAPEDVD